MDHPTDPPPAPPADPPPAPRLPLACDDVGRGEPVVFLHAFPLDARMWLPQREGLVTRCRVITPHLAGFGRSADLPAPTNLDAHANTLVALLDALSLPRATFVGLSMGGYIALAMARKHPTRVARLVLCDTRASGDSPAARAGRNDSIARVKQEGVAALVDMMLPRLLAPGADEGTAARVREIAESQPELSVCAALGAMRDRIDSTVMLQRANKPVLVLVGEHDATTPPEEARAMAAAVPNARVQVIPAAGHLSNLENPVAFNRALIDWIARTPVEP